jgi:uncharacterized integral membrane protein
VRPLSLAWLYALVVGVALIVLALRVRRLQWREGRRITEEGEAGSHKVV